VDWSSTHEEPLGHPDPNASRTSPSGSAIQRISTYDPPPSNSSTVSPDDQLYPLSASRPFHSTNSGANANFEMSREWIGPPSIQSSHGRLQLKLSELTNSGSGSASTRSESSRSSGTAVTGSIKTFPALRPSAQSERPPSSIASSKDLPDIPAQAEVSDQSSTSSIVRRAIQTALQLEAVDKEITPRPSRRLSPIASVHSDRSKTPTPADVIPKPLEERPALSVQSPPRSKLALLARQKAVAGDRSFPQSLPSPTSPSQISTSRPLSKLAMLAQQKVDASRVPKLPKTTTEYLTPIANGSSVTTAITTSYQSLYSLTDPSRRNIIPRLEVVPVQAPGSISTSPSDQRPSKLAMKIKRAADKPVLSPGFPSEDAIVSAPLSPLFQSTSTHARASPSAFASVLIYDDVNPPHNEGKNKYSAGGKERKPKEVKMIISHTSDQPLEETPVKPRKSKHSTSKDNNTFAFDGPSPDDIVLNARKKSGLKNFASATLPNASAATGKSLVSP